MSKKKKKTQHKPEAATAKFEVMPFLFLAVYAIISIWLFMKLYNQPFMVYMKGARYFWNMLFWIFTGAVGYNLFKPLKFLEKKYLIAAFVVLTFAGILFRMTTALYLSGDSGLYLILSKSIATFSGYKWIHMPVPRIEPNFGFGLPLLLLPATLVGINVTLANFIIALTTVLCTFLSYIAFRKYIDDEAAVLIAVTAVFSSYLLHFSTVIMTELPFCAFMMLSFYFFDKYKEDDTPEFGKYLFLTAGVVFYSYMIKPYGLAMLASFVIYLGLYKRHWKKMLYFGAIVFAGIILWNVRNYMATGDTGYIGGFLQSAAREGTVGARESSRGFGLLGNLFYKPFMIAAQGYKWFIPMMFSSIVVKLPTFVSILLSIVVYVGLFVNLIKHRSVLALTAIIIFYAIGVRNYLIEENRYYVPLIPFLYFFLVVGFKFLIENISKLINFKEKNNYIKLAIISVVILVFSVNIVLINIDIQSQHTGTKYPSVTLQDYYETGLWIKENLPEDAVLASRLDKEMFIFSGRKSVNARIYHAYDNQFTNEKGAEMIGNLQTKIIENDVDYYILSSTRSDMFMARTAISGNTQIFQSMFNVVHTSRNSTTWVLQVKEEWKKNNTGK
ncbi:ArnT family glycosyltransferase [candidate division KSB1 bacterium]